MINLNYVKRFCKEYWKIENYDLAMADESQVWHCHHRHEIDWVLPKEELISIGRYYDVHYSELIFLTPKEHISLHHKGKNVSEETRFKQSAAHKGKPSPNKGKKASEETRFKQSTARKGKYIRENSPSYKRICPILLYKYRIIDHLSYEKIAKIFNVSTTAICNKYKKEYKITK